MHTNCRARILNAQPRAGRRERWWRGRAGSVLLEAVVAGAVLSALLAAILPTVRLMDLMSRRADRQTIALTEAANTLDAVLVRDWDDVDPQRVADWPLSEFAQRQLPAAQLTIVVTDGDSELPARKVTVDVSYQDAAGRRVPPVRLVGWKYREGSQDD